MIDLQHSLLIIAYILMKITLANMKVLAQSRCTIDDRMSGDVGLAVVAFCLLHDTINLDHLEMVPHL
jgi:hypothetical protein